MLFLYIISDVTHPRHAKFEPSEHTYGKMRQYNQEMTVRVEVGIWQPILENLAVPLLVGLIKIGRIWKALVQTVFFLIIKLNFLHSFNSMWIFFFNGLV